MVCGGSSRGGEKWTVSAATWKGVSMDLLMDWLWYVRGRGASKTTPSILSWATTRLALTFTEMREIARGNCLGQKVGWEAQFWILLNWRGS